MKKVVKICIIIFLIIIIVPCYIVEADDEDEEQDYIVNQNDIDNVSNDLTKEPVLNSRRCIIYDRDSKRILYGKNENVKSAMASTTKIVTALVVLEKNENLDKTITVTKKAAGTGGSRLGLTKDDKITIRDLLYGLLMRSGNDAAVALAIETGGSVEDFANMMNKKAEEIGLIKTHFVTPHGLDDPNHYTTAYELAKLADVALENKIFANIVGTKRYTISINGNPKELINTNELLGTLNGVIGVKTGFTNGAGRCLVIETKRDSMDIITVVLGADTKKDRTRDSVKLIEYAFSNFKKINIKDEATEAFDNWNEINKNRINVIKGKSNNLRLQLGKINTEIIPININETDNVEYSINTISEINTPVLKNTKVGTLTIKYKGDIVEEVDILCNSEIKKKNLFDYFKESLNEFNKIAS